MNIGSKVTGADEIERALIRIEQTVQPRQAKKALRRGGWVIARKARVLVDKRTGGLARGIKVGDRALFQSPFDGIRVFVGPVSKLGARGTWEELGTIKQAADPFLRPALDQGRGEAIAEIGRVLAEDINRAGRG
ncbi:MAG: HK97-gp10 family putative phage morphogenesis protein [Allosphingosinicella sp.]